MSFLKDMLFDQNNMKQQKWTRLKVLLISFAARITLVLYSNIHDYIFKVNFTDIDYQVFNDAVHYISVGRSPFNRVTYRYTPALAWMLLPNEKWKDFGKILFCSFDIFVGWLLFEMNARYNSNFQTLISPLKRNKNIRCDITGRNIREMDEVTDSIINPVVLFWLANPLTAVISARGSADVLVCAAVLCTLYFIERKQWLVASLVYGGIAVHFKIYPLIYLPSIFLHLANYTDRGIFSQLKILFTNWRGFIFIAISIGSLSVILLGFYHVYGDKFFNEFLLYHISRRDIRHNFSLYFYLLYLIDDHIYLSRAIGFFAFLPQIVMILYFAFRYSSDLPFCWFVTTFVFVTLNKVCTSQYFVWYIVFLPLIVNRIKVSQNFSVKLIILWFLGQAIWLSSAYLFEFKGLPMFEIIWGSSLLFFIINCYILKQMIYYYSNAIKIKST